MSSKVLPTIRPLHVRFVSEQHTLNFLETNRYRKSLFLHVAMEPDILSEVTF